MAKPEIIKDMYLQEGEALEKALSALDILPGAYELYGRKESGLFDDKAFYGTFYQGAGNVNSQFIIGSIDGGTDTRMYIRRAFAWDNDTSNISFSSWKEVLTKGDSAKAYFDGTFVKTTGDEMTGNLIVSNGGTTSMSVKVQNSNGVVGIHASTNRGLYDFTSSNWIIVRSKDASKTYVPQWSNKGGATKFVYFNSDGTPVATTQSIGGTTQPIYMSSGVMTAMTQTVGAELRPVYLKEGKITQTSYKMAATNLTATTAIGIEALDNCVSGIWYVSGTSGIYNESDGVIINNIYNNAWQTEIYQDYRTGQLAARGKNNGTWQSWRKILDSDNFSTYLNDTYVNATGDIIKGSVDLSAAPAASNAAVPYAMGRTITGKNGGLHFQKTPSTDDHGNAITWSNTTDEVAQAGIYVKSSDVYGTKMYFATTNLYVDGAKAALEIDHLGNITALRGMFKGTASQVQYSLSVNGKTYNGSTSVDVGVMQVLYGGTGSSDQVANRLVWSESSSKIRASYHYANSSKIAVNSSSEPSYNLYVNGTSYFNGVVSLKSSLYTDSYTGGALDLNNSNIVGVNGIYFEDSVDSAGEGIHFYRSDTSTDTFYSSGGKLRYVPNRTLNSMGTAYYVPYTDASSGNTGTSTKPIYSDAGVLKAVSHDIGATHATKDTARKFYLLGTILTDTGYQETTYFDTGVYVTATSGQLSADTLHSRGNIYADTDIQLRRNSTMYGRWTAVVGTASTTEGQNGTQGYGELRLGNSTALSSTAGQGANNATGRVILYGSGSAATTIEAQAPGNYTFKLPNYSGTMYAAHTEGNGAVGGEKQLTYISGNGRITASTTDLGSTTKPVYMKAGVMTACSTYAGGTKVTLNGSDKGASTASFYAPTEVGTSGYILKSNGSGAPTWLQTLPVANGGTGTTSLTANKLVWTSSATTMTAANHYANASKIGVNSTSAPSQNFYVNGTSHLNGIVGIGGYNASYNLYVNGISYFNGRMVIKGNGSSYNEGLRILPADNGWSNIFFSADNTLSGTHDSGWLIGRRGADGSIAGAKGDFTIEEEESSGVNLTIHKNSNGATLQGLMRASQGFHVNRTNGDGYGLSLYGASAATDYGIHMSLTSNYGPYGQVTSDWATYFCFTGSTGRGWIFRHAGTNVFSVNGQGTLSIRENVPGIFFRPGHASYDANISYQTSGNEAMVFTTKNAVTSFMFVNGEDTITNMAADRWTKVTPGLQIKNNCVAIGKLIANGVNPTYKLEVAGDVYANGGWFRVSGNQGYFFETHGGGWYMIDSTYVRAYNDKAVYVSNSGQHAIYTAGGFASSKEAGIVFSTYYAGSWYSTLQTHGNGNLTVDAPSGSVYVAYLQGNTYFGGGTYYIDRSGNFNGKAAKATNLVVSEGTADAERPILVTTMASSGQNVFYRSTVTLNYSKQTITAPGGFIGNASTASKVIGSYTGSGGQQNPNYFGTNRVGFLMMNTTVNGNSQYKDWMIMDCYSGSDVGGAVAIGVNRQSLGAYIMRSAAARTSWAESAELLHTSNYTTYTVTKTGGGASGTWGINVSGNAATATTARAVSNTGYGNGTFTWYQSDGSFAGRSGWASYLISNHGDGASYYHQIIAMPFWSAPCYRRLEGGTAKGWYDFITDENYATKLDGRYVNTTGDTMSGNLAIEKASGTTSFTTKRTDTGASVSFMVGSGGTNRGVYDNNLGKWIIYSDGSNARTQLQLYGAVWNDYAEYRTYKDSDEVPYGRVVIENGDDSLSLSTERLQLGGNICSDTFGFAIGETDNAKLPIAVSGRVLAYTNESRDTYRPGEAVCTGPNGTVSKMTREEIKEYPDAIIGYVSAVPDYEVWGTGNVKVNGRIWIKVK